MADEPAPVIAPAPASVAAPVPAVAAPSQAAQPAVPIAGTGAEAAVAPPPASSPETAPVVVEAPKPAATEGSLLGDAKVADAPKPAEAAAPAPAPAPAEPPPAPTYEPFTLPEGVTLEAEKVSELTKLLGETELATKADHGAMQGLGQKLVDMYIAESKRVADAQQQSWIRTRDEWRNTFIADEQIGGARREATLRDCAKVIEDFGGNAEQQAQLRQAFGITGMGDHPALIRLLNNVAKVTNEPTKTATGTPAAARPASKSARRYNNSLNGAN